MEFNNFMREYAFFFIYGLFVAAGIVIARILISRDGSENHTMPNDDTFDAYALALVKNGTADVLRTALLVLVRDGLIEIKKKNGKYEYLVDITEEKPVNLHPVTAELYGRIRDGRNEASDLISKNGDLQVRIDELLTDTQDTLRRAHIYRSAEEINRARWIKWGGMLILLAPGLIKLVHDRGSNEPIGFLAGMLVLAALLIMLLVSAGPVSSLGRRYVANLCKSHTPDDDLVLLFALSGVKALRGVEPKYWPFMAMIDSEDHQDTGMSGGG